MPTGDWWTSLAWQPLSSPQFAHPLALQAERGGLRAYYPGARLFARGKIFSGAMAAARDDVVLGHTAAGPFAEARVAGWSDWFVSARFGDDETADSARGFTARYGHGSPFAYALFDGGDPQLTFPGVPQVWSGDAASPVLGVTIGPTHYGLFGPTGATWSGLGSQRLVCDLGGRRHFALAVLPNAEPETLALFRRHAYTHVVDTTADYAYQPQRGVVRVDFTFATETHEGEAAGVLTALYPHQRRRLVDSPAPLSSGYASVRGPMPLLAGERFSIELPVVGLLPSLPAVGELNRPRFDRLLADELKIAVEAAGKPPRDTYWEGKSLGRLATLLPIAEQLGADEAAAQIDAHLRRRLAAWFTPTDAAGRLKNSQVFCYEPTWGTLIGLPGSYGSNNELNDHHFHYGYFLRAAAEIARRDPAWASDEQWGPMIRLLARDIAAGDRDDPLFPHLRCFDPYAGHSWAAGHAAFADGNNQESSSEAVNAWSALVLLGEALGDRQLRDRALYLYASETTAVREYWFNAWGDNLPAAYEPAVVTMVWGGKSVHETWFTADPVMMHGINWLPIHAGSLYLGVDRENARGRHASLVKEYGGDMFRDWADLAIMHQALFEPAAARATFERRWEAHERGAARFPSEAGNALAHTEFWLASLAELGSPRGDVSADDPLAACFADEQGARRYVVYSFHAEPRQVRFSDGQQVSVTGRGFFIERAPAPEEKSP